MTRYRFNVYNRIGFVEDFEGRELPDLDAVRREAVRGVRSILREEVLNGRVDLRGRIEVLDPADRVVLRLRFDETVDILTDDG